MSKKKSNQTTRDVKTKISFMNYLLKHKDERFWQMLRNWSKASEIRICKYNKKLKCLDCEDTFYWE